jgi:hypothetical protein
MPCDSQSGRQAHRRHRAPDDWRVTDRSVTPSIMAPTHCPTCGRPWPEPRRLTCAHCGDDFEAARVDARYCSPRCRTAHHRAEHKAAR